MHFTKTLTDVRNAVTTDDAGKWDALVPCRQIALRNGRIVFSEADQNGFDNGLALTPWALSQASGKLGIPGQYMKRCPPELMDANFNHWIHADGPDGSDEDTWLIRAKGSSARGILSDRYSRLDNAFLLDSLMPLVPENRYKIGLSQISEESFHLRLIEPAIGKEVLEGDKLMVGIHLTNSEVGLRSVTVDALVFREVCTNGLIRRINGKSCLRQRHIHLSEPRFREVLAEAIGEAVLTASAFIEQMASSTRIAVPDPEHALEVLKEAWVLPVATVETVLFHLHGESRPDTLYGLVNAITQAAQRIGGIEERFELELLAGRLIDTDSGNSGDAALRRRIMARKGENN